MIIKKHSSLKGEVQIPGDKSISHRGIMFGALSDGRTELTNFLEGADCLSTISCFQKMGIEISRNASSVSIIGKGLHGLREPDSLLDVGNSGTTTRLISGILAGQPFVSHLNGDASIQKRPMKRIMDPLSRMGADIQSDKKNGCAPLTIRPAELKGIHYTSQIASAQVKSCVLLAGLYADGETSVTEPSLSRDHTERMLRAFGADVVSDGTTATITPDPVLKGRKIVVPGDISSAAYFIAAGLLCENSEILIKNVGTNPTRDGILRVCREMGADITYLNESGDLLEPAADLCVRSSALKAVTIGGSLIPALIDEIPMIAVMACFANGTTVIKDAAELKVKESNRIDVVVENLKKMGADIEATEDGMVIHGGKPLHGAIIDPHLDHRIAMSFAIAGLAADGETEILNSDCVAISYPEFYRDLEKLL